MSAYVGCFGGRRGEPALPPGTLSPRGLAPAPPVKVTGNPPPSCTTVRGEASAPRPVVVGIAGIAVTNSLSDTGETAGSETDSQL